MAEQEIISEVQRFINAIVVKREEVDKKIENFAYRIKDVKSIPLLQSEILSYRQIVLEEIHRILDKLVILNGRMREERKIEIERINSNVQVRYQSADERNAVSSGGKGLVILNQNIEILTNYTMFLKDTMDNLDSMKYAVRTSFDVNTFLGVVPK